MTQPCPCTSTRGITSPRHPPSAGQGAEALGRGTILVAFAGGHRGLPARPAPLGVPQSPPLAGNRGMHRSRGPGAGLPAEGAEALRPRLPVRPAPHGAARTPPRVPLPGSSRVLPRLPAPPASSPPAVPASCPRCGPPELLPGRLPPPGNACRTKGARCLVRISWDFHKAINSGKTKNGGQMADGGSPRVGAGGAAQAGSPSVAGAGGGQGPESRRAQVPGGAWGDPALCVGPPSPHLLRQGRSGHQELQVPPSPACPVAVRTGLSCATLRRSHPPVSVFAVRFLSCFMKERHLLFRIQVLSVGNTASPCLRHPAGPRPVRCPHPRAHEQDRDRHCP